MPLASGVLVLVRMSVPRGQGLGLPLFGQGTENRAWHTGLPERSGASMVLQLAVILLELWYHFALFSSCLSYLPRC